MRNIKPIRTAYNNYLFRSRLEARWAVFFDALGIRYEYEPEMQEVGKIQVYNYIPDFFLPDLDLYVEIKGQQPNETELSKAAGWARDVEDIIILFGNINKPIGWFLAVPYGYVKDPVPILHRDYAFCECLRCGKIGVSANACEMPDFCNPEINLESTCFTITEYTEQKLPNGHTSQKLATACKKAIFYVFDDSRKHQSNFRNKTNTAGGHPTQKMINYAKYLVKKWNDEADSDEIIDIEDIENWSFEEVSDLINELIDEIEED